MKKIAFSKQLIKDIRSLLWIVTIGGLLLAFYCIFKGYTGSLPWIGSMVGLPWTAHGVICSFYMNKSFFREKPNREKIANKLKNPEDGCKVVIEFDGRRRKGS